MFIPLIQSILTYVLQFARDTDEEYGIIYIVYCHPTVSLQQKPTHMGLYFTFTTVSHPYRTLWTSVVIGILLALARSLNFKAILIPMLWLFSSPVILTKWQTQCVKSQTLKCRALPEWQFTLCMHLTMHVHMYGKKVVQYSIFSLSTGEPKGFSWAILGLHGLITMTI